MNVLRLSAVLALALALCGCAVSGPIQKVDNSSSVFVDSGETRLIVDATELAKYPVTEHYRVFEQCYTGYGSIPEARDHAMPRVVKFCTSLNKEPKVLKEITSIPPHTFGNWPSIEITFVCVDKPETLGNVIIGDDRYAKILQLKTLLDKSAITQEEFYTEKNKILNQ